MSAFEPPLLVIGFAIIFAWSIAQFRANRVSQIYRGFLWLVIIMGCVLILQKPEITDKAVSLFGELVVAFVIYYEIEAGRASEFFKEVSEDANNEQRSDIYDRY